MAFSKTVLFVVFAVLLISAAVSAHRDRDLFANGKGWRPDGRGGYNRGGKEESGAVDAGKGGGKGGNGGGNGGKGGNGGGGGHGPETEN